MAFTVEEIITRIKTEADPRMLDLYVKELRDMKTAASDGTQSMTALGAAMGVAQLAVHAIEAGLHELVNAAREGWHEFLDMESTFRRTAVTAGTLGIEFGRIVEAAEKLSSPVLEAKDAMAQLDLLLKKGFTLPQAETLVKNLQDIAAVGKEAGTTVPAAMEKLVDAFVKGRARGVELFQMFPQLKATMAAWTKDTSEAEKRQSLLNATMKQGAIDAGGLARYLESAEGQVEAFNLTVRESKEAFVAGMVPGIQAGIKALAECVKGTGDLEHGVMELGARVGDVFKFIGGMAAVVIDSWHLMGLEWQYFVNSVEIGALKAVQAVGLMFTGFEKGAQFWAKVLGISVKAFDEEIAKNVQSLKDMNIILAIAENVQTSLADKIKNQTNKVLGDMGEALSGVTRALPGFSSNTRGAGTALGDFAVEAGGASKELKALFKSAEEGEKGFSNAIADTDAALADSTQLTLARLIAVQDQYQASLKVLQEARDKFAAAPSKDTLKGLQDSLKNSEKLYKEQTKLQKEQLKLQDDAAQAHYDYLKKIQDDWAKDFQNIAKENGKAITDMFERAAAESQKARDKIATDWLMMASAFQQVGDLIGGTFGGIFDVLGSGFAGVAEAVKNGTNQMYAFTQAAGAALSQFGEWGKIAGAALQGASNIAMGLASNNPIQVLQGIVQAAGAAFAALKKLFEHDYAKDVKNVTYGLQLSKELTKQIADLAKELHNAQAAVLLSFSDIVDELGVTKTNFEQIYKLAHDLFSGIQTGAITAAQAAEELNDTFARMAEVADAAGGQMSAQLVDLINLTKQFGLEVQAVTDYINKQIGVVAESTKTLATSLKEAMDAIPAGITGGGPFSAAGPIGTPTGILPPTDLGKWGNNIDEVKAKYDTLLSLVSGGIAQILANGGTLTDVFAQFGDQLDVLQEAAERFGFSMDGSLGDLIGLGDLIHGKLGKMITDISAVGSAMSALAHLGIAPSALEFDKFGDSVDKTYKKLMKGGASSQLALAQMAPQLKIIAQLQQQFGLEVDKGTQKLIDQARAAGLLDPDPQEQMVNILKEMVGVLVDIKNGLFGATAATDGFTNSLNNVPTDIDVNVNTHFNSDGPTTPSPGPGWVWVPGKGWQPPPGWVWNPQNASTTQNSQLSTQSSSFTITDVTLKIGDTEFNATMTGRMETGQIALPRTPRYRQRIAS